MINPLVFYTKTEQISGDALDGESDLLSTCEPLDVDKQFGIDQGAPGTKSALLTTGIYLDDACALPPECEATYNLRAAVQAPIFVRGVGEVWDRTITGGDTLDIPDQLNLGDDLFAVTAGLGIPDPDGLGVRWFKHQHFAGGTFKFYQRIGGATLDADDEFKMTGVAGPRTNLGVMYSVGNEHTFFVPPIQNLILFQGGVLNQVTRGEFDTTWDILPIAGVSLSEQVDPPDLATEAHNTWVHCLYCQARTLGNPFFPNPLVSFGNSPVGTSVIVEAVSSSGFESSVMMGIGGKFYANSTEILGEGLGYAVTTGFTQQALQYTRWRPN